MRRTTIAVAAAGAALALGLSACGGPTGTTNQAGGQSAAGQTAKFNDALTGVVNPSDKKGGTLTFANSGDWDSLDGADTYYAYSWDFIRLYGRSLTGDTLMRGSG